MKGSKDDNNKRESILARLESLFSFCLEGNIYEFELEEKGSRIRFRREIPESGPKEETVKKKPLIAYHEIISPLTGTFYHTPSPDAPPFVKTGSLVKEGQALGLIEAMKLFNEIKSEVSGKVAEILVGNGQGVRRGDILMKIERI